MIALRWGQAVAGTLDRNSALIRSTASIAFGAL
jgi:hypothetical protein